MTNILVIDCFKQVKGAGKSIGIYNLALNLVRNLAAQKQNGTLADKKIIVFGNEHNRNDFDIEGVEFIQVPFNPFNKLRCIWWELFQVPFWGKKFQADRMVFPRGYASMLRFCKETVIIHDMIPFYYHEHYPDFFNKLENFYIMWRLKASARKADQVITISEASKRDILHYSHCDESKIIVINNGYNGMKNIPEQVEKENYIIAVTSGLPHKNAEGIVKAYEAYCKKSEAPLPLKIIGIADVEKYHLDADVKSYITCYKYIESDLEMHKMIAKAKVFLFLSLVEGFGFPPIEAMQLGTPVICSGITSLPEVVGDAAVLVTPEDAQAVAEEMIALLQDENRQQELIAKGYENIKRFSWDGIIKKYIEVLL